MLIANFFTDLYDKINDWFKLTFKFDEIARSLYETIIAPLPELVKMVGTLFLALIIVLGIISFIKKFIKTSIAIAIIIAIIVIFVVLK